MMFSLADYYFIAFGNKLFSEGIGDKVDRSRGSRSKNYFFATVCPYEILYKVASSFIVARCDVRKMVDSAMEICIMVEGNVIPLVYNALWTLRSGSIIEINQLFSIHYCRQLRELFPQRFYALELN